MLLCYVRTVRLLFNLRPNIYNLVQLLSWLKISFIKLNTHTGHTYTQGLQTIILSMPIEVVLSFSINLLKYYLLKIFAQILSPFYFVQDLHTCIHKHASLIHIHFEIHMLFIRIIKKIQSILLFWSVSSTVHVYCSFDRAYTNFIHHSVHIVVYCYDDFISVGVVRFFPLALIYVVILLFFVVCSSFNYNYYCQWLHAI